MRAASPPPPPTWIDALPGWLFTAAGSVLLAVVVLVPAWLSHHEAAWRLGVMRAQADALAQQRANYEGFAAALADDDPVVLERLALSHLNLTAPGRYPVRLSAEDSQRVAQSTADVGAWLAVPQPVIGQDLPAYTAPDNRLTRVALGPGRPALLAVGLICIIGGIFFNPGQSTRPEPRREEEPDADATPLHPDTEPVLGRTVAADQQAA